MYVFIVWTWPKQTNVSPFKRKIMLQLQTNITSYFPNFYKCPKVPKNVKVSGRKTILFKNPDLTITQRKENHLPV